MGRKESLLLNKYIGSLDMVRDVPELMDKTGVISYFRSSQQNEKILWLGWKLERGFKSLWCLL